MLHVVHTCHAACSPHVPAGLRVPPAQPQHYRHTFLRLVPGRVTTSFDNLLSATCRFQDLTEDSGHLQRSSDPGLQIDGVLPGSQHSGGGSSGELISTSCVPEFEQSSSPVRESMRSQHPSRLGRLPALSMPPLVGSVSPELADQGGDDTPHSAADSEPQEHEDSTMLELYTAAMQRPSSSRSQKHR